ncbi:hypothetical protein BP5796_10307 [Coleophoma crateriformis]|uniref:Uncharacterized protein n=1 Tax=Coleophoma crateriformis TaxID=565419 RepID=A0A3D8QV12_9HELO|nr:hypothetical protein BP5796_10307 [Coleophoma crateriformis]
MKPSRQTSYKGPQDVPDLLNSDEWSPAALFPKPIPLDATAFPPQPQPYLDLVRRLRNNGHSELGYLDAELRRQNGTVHAERSRAAVVEFTSPGVATQPQLFQNSKNLTSYLAGAQQASSSHLYIVEDISANYVEAFGSQFAMDPTFWAAHLRTTNWESNQAPGNVSCLPSIKRQGESYSLLYSDQLFLQGPMFSTELPLFADCNVYRKINLFQEGMFYDGIGSVTRRASYWTRAKPDGCWDALILVDPGIKNTVYAHNMSKATMKPIAISQQTPYQGGYIDFLPMRHKSSPSYTAPPRTSIFDDLIFYHGLNYASLDSLEAPFIPDAADSFLRSIVAGMWMNTIAYVSTSISVLEYAIQQSKGKSTVKAKLHSYSGLNWLDEYLLHIHYWNLRCSLLHDWANQNLAELSIPQFRPAAAKSQALKKDSSSLELQDWVFIKTRLEHWETRSRDLVSSALGLLSLVESHKSLEEAESARTLAILGTVYLPLSLAAGVLSMGGDFIPGKAYFWVFFAVALPLMFLSFLSMVGLNRLRGFIERF